MTTAQPVIHIRDHSIVTKYCTHGPSEFCGHCWPIASRGEDWTPKLARLKWRDVIVGTRLAHYLSGETRVVREILGLAFDVGDHPFAIVPFEEVDCGIWIAAPPDGFMIIHMNHAPGTTCTSGCEYFTFVEAQAQIGPTSNAASPAPPRVGAKYPDPKMEKLLEQRPLDQQTPAASDHHRAISDVVGYFKSDHLPASLAEISRHFEALAKYVDRIPVNCGVAAGQRAIAIQKLLEAKDCAVRAALG